MRDSKYLPLDWKVRIYIWGAGRRSFWKSSWGRGGGKRGGGDGEKKNTSGERRWGGSDESSVQLRHPGKEGKEGNKVRGKDTGREKKEMPG